METVDLKQNESLNIDTYYYFTSYLQTGERQLANEIVRLLGIKGRIG